MRWLVFIALLFLALMSLARFALYLTYSSPQQPFGYSLPAFWLGLRYDLRDVGILCVVLLILGFIPVFHPYKGRGGQAAWFTLLWLAAVIVHGGLQPGLPILCLFIATAERKCPELRKGDADTSLSMIWESYPVIRIFLTIIGVTLVIMVLFSAGAIGGCPRPKHRPSAGPGGSGEAYFSCCWPGAYSAIWVSTPCAGVTPSPSRTTVRPNLR